MKYVLFSAYIILSALGIILMKAGGGVSKFSLTAGRIDMILDTRLLFGALCYIGSFLVFVIVMQKFNLSEFYPMAAGLILISTVIAGVVIFHDKLSIVNIIGITAILIGIVLLNIKGKV
jgi:multidrug transporter EmrE-like cation transporter